MHDYPVNRQRLIDTFLGLLAINAPSREEAPVAERVKLLLADHGATFIEDHAAEMLGGNCNNFVARIPGTLDAPPILFCAHLDTVQPTPGLQIIHAEGVIRADGTTILGADDRAGVAAMLELVRVLDETGVTRPPIELLFTVAEEVGLMGSQVLDHSIVTAQIGFVPDSSSDIGHIITRAPAQKHLDITIRGKAAHAGMAPENGISAIVVAAQAIARMRLGRIDDETTANIGTIEGGQATNIVPEVVFLAGEARSRNPLKLDEQAAHMQSCFEEAAKEAGAIAIVEISDVYPAFNLSSDATPVTWAADAARALGVQPTIIATGGGSDANFLNQLGIAAVILSTGYHNPHCTDEYQSEDQLVQLAQWLYQIVVQAGRERNQ